MLYYHKLQAWIINGVSAFALSEPGSVIQDVPLNDRYFT